MIVVDVDYSTEGGGTFTILSSDGRVIGAGISTARGSNWLGRFLASYQQPPIYRWRVEQPHQPCLRLKRGPK